MADFDPNCLFCKIAAGTVPADVVQQDDEVVAFRDINPKAPTHILLIPRRHIASAADLRARDSEMLGRLFGMAAHIARDMGISERGYRIVSNVGAAAGQTVFHLHFHLMGGRSMSWPPG